jgi:hypothetical protein
MTAKLRRIRAADFASYERNGRSAPAYRTNGVGGVVALAAVNGPGAYQKRFGLRRPTRSNLPLRAQVVSTGGGHARLVFRDAAPPSRSRGRSPGGARLRTNSAADGRGIARAAKGKNMAKRSKKSKGARKRKSSKRRSYRSNKRKGFRANKRSMRKKNKARRGKKKSARRSSKRAYRANKKSRRGSSKRSKRSKRGSRRASKRTSFRKNGSSKRRSRRASKRGYRRNGRARKASITRGRITVIRSFTRKGKNKQRKLASYAYKGRRGYKGVVSVAMPGKRGSMLGRKATVPFKANGRRRGVSRRRGFRRNGTFAPILAAFKTGAPAFGGFAAHRVLTGVIAEYAGSYLPVPEGAKVPVVSVLVAALGSVAAAALIKGPAGALVIAGMGLSTLSQLAMAGLRAAGQEGAASAIAGIPTGAITSYGAYELVPNGVSGYGGFGALPYAQALAGMGALPYAQALAGTNPYAARGNYLDAPALGMGAYPEQALAAAYPEQAAAGYGSYELTPEGGVLNGIGTDAASIEHALNQADRGGAVQGYSGFGGFGADSIGRESILIPDGVQSAVSATPELPMTAGNFSGNVFGVGFLADRSGQTHSVSNTDPARGEDRRAGLFLTVPSFHVAAITGKQPVIQASAASNRKKKAKTWRS